MALPIFAWENREVGDLCRHTVNRRRQPSDKASKHHAAAREQQSIAFVRTAQILPEIDRAEGQLRDMRNSAKGSRRPVSLTRSPCYGRPLSSRFPGRRRRVSVKPAAHVWWQRQQQGCEAACIALYSRQTVLGQNTGWFRSAPITADGWTTDLYRRIDGTWRCYLTTCTAPPMCAT